MIKRVLLCATLIVLGVGLAGCGTPPPLRSDKYLNDRSLVGKTSSCPEPCFAGITIGQTTFADAVSKVKANTDQFTNVQNQDNPPQAAWAAKNGEACCQMSGDPKTGLVDAILVRVAPVMTTKEIVDKFGPPQYISVLAQDYSPEEVAMGLIYPKQGNVIWVSPGNSSSSLTEATPVVIVLYLDPKKFDDVLATATLQGWDGYKTYQTYKAYTPALTPRITLTPKP